MSDSEIIQTAYATALETLFADFFSALATAGANQQEVAETTQHFRNGIALVRKARDEALRLVQQPG